MNDFVSETTGQSISKTKTVDRYKKEKRKWFLWVTLYIRFWGPGQPNSYKWNQDCAVLQQESIGVGGWNDFGCTTEQTWICEK